MIIEEMRVALPPPDSGTVQVGRDEVSCGYSEEAMLAYGAACAAAALAQPTPCIGGDPTCPCQDGDACHYKDTPTTKGWPVPAQRADEPVAWLHPDWPQYRGPHSMVTTYEVTGWIPLYTAAQAAPAYVPLTADDVWNSREIMTINGARAGLLMSVLMDLVGAIESLVVARMRGER